MGSVPAPGPPCTNTTGIPSGFPDSSKYTECSAETASMPLLRASMGGNRGTGPSGSEGEGGIVRLEAPRARAGLPIHELVQAGEVTRARPLLGPESREVLRVHLAVDQPNPAGLHPAHEHHERALARV